MQSLQKPLFIAAAITFIIVIGAAVYEHMAVVPVWKKAPPRSLAMFNGPYAVTPDKFWKLIHPICLLLSIGALIVCWRTPAKANLAIMLAGYAVVLGVTAAYFVPELLRITQTPFSDTVDAGLVKRAQAWETLSLVRMALLFGLASVMLAGMFRMEQPLAQVGRQLGRKASGAAMTTAQPRSTPANAVKEAVG